MLSFQARDADFMCRSVTLAGGLLLLIWSENDRKQRSEDMGLPSGARARPCRARPSHATATLDAAARAPHRAPPLRPPTPPPHTARHGVDKLGPAAALRVSAAVRPPPLCAAFSPQPGRSRHRRVLLTFRPRVSFF